MIPTYPNPTIAIRKGALTRGRRKLFHWSPFREESERSHRSRLSEMAQRPASRCSWGPLAWLWVPLFPHPQPMMRKKRPASDIEGIYCRVSALRLLTILLLCNNTDMACQTRRQLIQTA
jgi:hypothetical protein